MEIKVIKSPDYNVVTETVIIWQNSSKRNYKNLILCIILILFLLATAYFKAAKTGSFWNFYSCFGIAYIFFLLLAFINQYERKSKLISNAAACYKKRNEQEISTEYIFTEEKITIKDLESYGEIKWSAFSHYELYNGYLLLFFQYHESSSIAIVSELLSKENFSTLIQFIESKLLNRNK